VGSVSSSVGNSRAKRGMKRCSSGTGGKPGAISARHFAVLMMVAARKNALPPV